MAASLQLIFFDSWRRMAARATICTHAVAGCPMRRFSGVPAAAAFSSSPQRVEVLLGFSRCAGSPRVLALGMMVEVASSLPKVVGLRLG